MQLRNVSHRLFGSAGKCSLSVSNLAFGELRRALTVDWVVFTLVIVLIVALLPLTPRSTESALHLAAYINDEPALTMALDAMTRHPLGNPANLYGVPSNPENPPGPEWAGLSYGVDYTYYGGVYPGLGFLAYGPLKLLGMPVFPTAPLILRVISSVAAIVSMVVLYNFGKRYVGVAAGLIAAVFLMTDSGFLYYATIIHPDTLQLLIGLWALLLAIRHANDGNMISLVALGMIAGVSQGTKVGGPWLIPTALLALYWGLMVARHKHDTWLSVTMTIVKRGALLGVIALAFWFMTTPYAFLNGTYFTALLEVWKVVTVDHFGRGGFANWVTTFYQHFGLLVLVLLGGGLTYAMGKSVTGRLDRPLVLALVLAVTQLVWFAVTNRVWITVGYNMLAYGLAAVFAVMLARDFLSLVRHHWSPAASLLKVCAIGVMVIIGWDRAYASASYILNQHTRQNSTVNLINDWAVKAGVPSDAVIVWDDLSIFDPKRFPNARMHGGLFNWAHIRRYNPDYIVLSSTLYASPHYSKLIETDDRARSDTYTYSVRFYQDLLRGGEQPKTAIPWINLVHIIEPGSDTRAAPDVKWPREVPLFLTESPLVGPIVQQQALKLSSQLTALKRYYFNIVGKRQDRSGPILRIYKVNSKDHPCPREHTFADSYVPGQLPVYAFDGISQYGLGQFWQSAKTGKDAKGSFVGIDLGCGTEHGGDEIIVRWQNPDMIPLTARVEISDDKQNWTTLGRLEISNPIVNQIGREDRIKLMHSRKARYWRFVAERLQENGGFAVQDIIIPEQNVH